MVSKAFIEHLKKNEGYADIAPSRKHSQTKSSHGAYYDPKGYLTTGYGSLISLAAQGSKQEKKDIDAFIEKHGIDPFTLTKEQAHSFLTTKILPKYELGLNKFLTENNLNNLSPTQKEGLLDMSFNMGGTKGKVAKGKSGLRGFASMFKALQEGNIENIEKEAKDSQWFKKDVGRSRSLLVIEKLKNLNKEKEESPLTPQQLEAMGERQYQERQEMKMRLLKNQRKPASVKKTPEVKKKVKVESTSVIESIIRDRKIPKKKQQEKKEVKVESTNILESVIRDRKVPKQKEEFKGSFYDRKVLEAKARNVSRNEKKRLNEENINKLAELGELGIRN